jgi:uncharacterized protein
MTQCVMGDGPVPRRHASASSATPHDGQRSCRTLAEDPTTICNSARLSAYDIYMERYLQKVNSKADSLERLTIQTEQRRWRERRAYCLDNADCLENIYLDSGALIIVEEVMSRITALLIGIAALTLISSTRSGVCPRRAPGASIRSIVRCGSMSRRDFLCWPSP